MQTRPDEIRVVIRLVGVAGDEPRLIHARVFRRIFNNIFSAIKAADREINDKKSSSELFVSHLKIGSNEFGIIEHKKTALGAKAPAIDLFMQCAKDVYHSDYARVMQYPRLAKEIVKLGSKLDDQYAVTASHCGNGELPIDAFFARQASRLKHAMSSDAIDACFAGVAITSFDGNLGEIDYRGAVWVGHLVLDGSDRQIECVFDKTQGEDAFNPFGNKRVSITGRAIYAGDSKLPERIEVISIEEIARAVDAIDIRGTMTGKSYFSWNGNDKNVDRH
jgi:hypothetical protein